MQRVILNHNQYFIQQESEIAKPLEGQVRIQVHASGVNFAGETKADLS